MCKYGFNLLWSKEDEGFIATCPDFPGLSAFGETPEEALTEAKIALGLFIESLQASGDSLPEVSEVIEYSGQIRLRMPKSLHSSLAQNAAKENVSLNTWLITLLSERNSTASLVGKVCSKIESMDETLKTQKTETKVLMELANTAFATIALTSASPPYLFSSEGPIDSAFWPVPTVSTVPADGYEASINISATSKVIYN